MLWPHTKTHDVYNKETSKIKKHKSQIIYICPG